MIKNQIIMVIIFAALTSCAPRHSPDMTAADYGKQTVQTEPVKIEIPVDDADTKIESVDLSVSKRVETNINMCLKNKYFTMTLTNQIDTVALDNTLVNAGICEESTFSCEGTNTLHQTGLRIIICPTQ